MEFIIFTLATLFCFLNIIFEFAPIGFTLLISIITFLYCVIELLNNRDGYLTKFGIVFFICSIISIAYCACVIIFHIDVKSFFSLM